MKKNICLFFSVLFVLFPLIGCDDKNNDTSSVVGNVGTRGFMGAIYRDVFYSFSTTGFTIKGLDLAQASSDMLPLCSDSLCLHSSDTCPAFVAGSGISLMCIDEKESEKNGGHPVFYFATQFLSSPFQSIIRFDSRTNTREILLDGIPDMITDFWMLDNLIFFETRGEQKLHAFDVKTKALCSLSMEHTVSDILIGGVDETHVYFTDDMGAVFRAPHDLSSYEYLLSGMSHAGLVISDTHIYYMDNLRVVKKVDVYEFMGNDLLRVPKDDPGATPEIAISGMKYVDYGIVFRSGNELIYYLAEDCDYHGTEDYSTESGESGTWRRDENGTTLYAYDMRTGTSRTICADSAITIRAVQAVNDQYLVTFGYYWETPSPQKQIATNLKTGEQTVYDFPQAGHQIE